MIVTNHWPQMPSQPINTDAERIVAIAESKLRESHYFAVREIRCQFHDGVLILRGQVSSFYLKQVAQSLVCNIEKVAHIDNRLRVV